MALVNQKTNERVGNANYVLYKLAAQPGASCDSSTVALTGNSCIFYDITKGNISVPSSDGSPNCAPPPLGGLGVLIDASGNPAWTTNAGYDMATGLGSINANNLVNDWSTASFTNSTTLLTSLAPVSITHGQPVNVGITVAPKTGAGVPTGTVALMGSPNGTPQDIDNSTLTNGVASWTSKVFPGGTYNVTAHYTGDGIYGASNSTGVQISVAKQASNSTTALVSGTNATSAFYGENYIVRTDVFSMALGQDCSASMGAESACPTGTIAYLDNGTPLNGGPYPLNSEGYDYAHEIQLTAGSHQLGAQYSGDNSFSASTNTQAITIVPAATFIIEVQFPTAVAVGQSFTLNAIVGTSSCGLAPSGTVTFLADGNPLVGSLQLTPTAGACGSNLTINLASMLAILNASFSTPGNHLVTIIYSGDTNYAATTSSANIEAQYTPAYVNLAANPQSVAYGSRVTLTAVVGGVSKTIAPTGTVWFQNADGLVGGNVSYTTTTDNSGNLVLQAVLVYTPQFGQTVVANYSGDANYVGAISPQANVTVTGGTFTIASVSNITIASPGQSEGATVTLIPSGFTGTVNVTCSLPTAMAESSCPAANGNITDASPIQVNITISTTGPHQVSKSSTRPFGLYASCALAGLFLFAVPRSRSCKMPFALLLFGLVLIVSCGGHSRPAAVRCNPGLETRPFWPFSSPFGECSGRTGSPWSRLHQFERQPRPEHSLGPAYVSDHRRNGRV
jgi:hypothetical protein